MTWDIQTSNKSMLARTPDVQTYNVLLDKRNNYEDIQHLAPSERGETNRGSIAKESIIYYADPNRIFVEEERQTISAKPLMFNLPKDH
jgi:hypothetical protein